MDGHQSKQIEVIDQIESSIANNTPAFSTILPVDDFENDSRLTLTSVHFPNIQLINTIQRCIIDPLKLITPDHYYYSNDSLHMTIKNIRVINDPPHFNNDDTKVAKRIFNEVIPKHKKFKVFFYRLLLFKNNLALIGTTEPKLDKIILDLDEKLSQAKLPDDKIYLNSKYFFSNITLARFTQPLTAMFESKVSELSAQLNFPDYTVDSVTLLTGNAVMKRREVIGTWELL